MLRFSIPIAVAMAVLSATGCASLSLADAVPDSASIVLPVQTPPDTASPKSKAGEKDENDKKDERGEKDKKDEKPAAEHKPAKTIFEWSIGPEKKDADEGGVNEEPKEKPLDTDRPDFGAATTTVGKGRAILETGYTFYHDRGNEGNFTGHTYPDALLRLGMFAEWFEFRIGQSFSNLRTTPVAGANTPVGPPTQVQTGAQDLYLGTKLALTEQKSYLPESVIILQSTVPSGSQDLTAGRVLPGIIYLYGWDIVENKLDFSGLFEADKVVDQSNNSYTQLAQTLEVRYYWTPKIRTFLEMLALYPVNATAPGVGPQYYAHPGFTYFVTNDLQLDFHVYIGLNRHATDFFGGPGLSVRY
jgi:hypothetical protein